MSTEPGSRLRQVAGDVTVAVAVVLAAAALLIVLWFAREAVVWLIASAFLAFSIDPFVQMLRRRGLGRGAAIATAFLLAAVGILCVAFVVVPPVVEGARALREEIPEYVDQLQDTEAASALNAEEAIESTGSAAQETANVFSQAGRAVDLIGAVASGAFAAFMIFTFTVYFLAYGRDLRYRIGRRLSPSGRERYLRATRRIYAMNQGYWYGKFIIAVFAGLTCYLGMRVLDLPFAAPLSFFLALVGLIPNIGATLGTIPVALVGLLEEPWKGVAITALLLLYQQFENAVLTPKVFKQTVKIHPFVSFTAVAVYGMVFGLVGALLAIPVTKGIEIAVEEARARPDSTAAGG